MNEDDEMTSLDLDSVLRGKWEAGTRPKDLFESHIAEHPREHVDDIIAGLSSKNRRVQGGCAELASLLSEAHPELVYPHVTLFLKNLSAKAPILRWEAVCTVGNLARVDDGALIPSRVKDITACLHHESIVLQGHAVRALSKIAKVFPETAGGIFGALAGAKDRFPGNRIGYVLEAMAVFVGDPALATRARRFVEPYLDSEVRAVATKARRAHKVLAKTR